MVFSLVLTEIPVAQGTSLGIRIQEEMTLYVVSVDNRLKGILQLFLGDFKIKLSVVPLWHSHGKTSGKMIFSRSGKINAILCLVREM